MTRTGNARWLTVAALALLVSVAGCGGGEGDGDSARTAELEALRSARDELVQLRQEKADLEARIESLASEQASGDEAEAGSVEGEEVAAEGAQTAPTVEGLEAELDRLEAVLLEKTDQFGAAVVTFINSDPPVQGEPVEPEVQEVIGLKIAEDMIVAQEYIDKGGDYRRALDIYQQLAVLDPENADLQAAIAKAEEMRYMTAERFALAKKGMTQDEVREVLGPVNVYNIKEYEDKGVVSWLYPRAESGWAAGVYFNQKNGEWRAYQLDFDAVKPAQEGS